MSDVRNETRKRRITVIDAAILFLVILLMVQMWLLTATLESFLAGHTDAAMPGVCISAVLFGLCFALYRFVAGIDNDRDEPRA